MTTNWLRSLRHAFQGMTNRRKLRRRRATVKGGFVPAIESLENRVLLTTFYIEDYNTETMSFVEHGTNPVETQIKSDGTTDVTAYINDAIRDVGNGNTLEFQKKDYTWGEGNVNYRVSGTINLDELNHFTLVGNGVRFQWYGDGDGPGDNHNKALVSIGGTPHAHDILLTQVNVKGTNPDKGTFQREAAFESGFSIQGYNVNMVGVQALNTFGDGLTVGRNGHDLRPHNINVLWSRFEDNARQGMAYTTGWDVTFAANYIDDSGRTSIDIEPWGGTAENFHRADYVRVVGNMIGSTNFQHIAVGGAGISRSVYIADNTFFGPAGIRSIYTWSSGIEGLEPDSNHVIINNTWTADSLSDVNSLVIQVNRIRGVFIAGNEFDTSALSSSAGQIIRVWYTQGIAIVDNYVHDGISTTPVDIPFVTISNAEPKTTRVWQSENVLQYTPGWASRTTATLLTNADGTPIAYGLNAPHSTPETPEGQIVGITRFRNDPETVWHGLLKSEGDDLSLVHTNEMGHFRDGWTVGAGTANYGWFQVPLPEVNPAPKPDSSSSSAAQSSAVESAALEEALVRLAFPTEDDEEITLLAG